MAGTITQETDDEIVMQCAQCEFHVHFYRKPIHGYVTPSKPQTGTLKVFLTCDNPQTPHTNAYTVRP